MTVSPRPKIQLSFEWGISEPRQGFQLLSKVSYNFEFICLTSVFYAVRASNDTSHYSRNNIRINKIRLNKKTIWVYNTSPPNEGSEQK